MRSSNTEIRSSSSRIAASMRPASCAPFVRGSSPRDAAAWLRDMKRVRVLLAVMLAAGAFAAHGQDKACSKADAAAAEKAIDRVVTWPQMQKAWQDYRHCDTGNVDDQF